MGQITIYTPFSLNTPPFEFFLSIYFRNIAELYGLHNDTYFPSKTLQNSTDYATMLVLTSGMLRNFTDYATMLVLRVPKGANKVRKRTASTPG